MTVPDNPTYRDDTGPTSPTRHAIFDAYWDADRLAETLAKLAADPILDRISFRPVIPRPAIRRMISDLRALQSALTYTLPPECPDWKLSR